MRSNSIRQSKRATRLPNMLTEQVSTLSEKAYGILEEMIVTLKLEPGRVISEALLSQAISIGRTPLREALQRLAVEGLVSSLPRRGLIVSEINITQHLALLETRRVLDRLVLSRAARRATREQRDALLACAAGMERAAASKDLTTFMKLDRDFDAIVEAASRNAFAARALAPLHVHCRRFWYMYHHNGDLSRSATLHVQVMEAVARADEEVAAASADRLVDYLEEFTRSAFDW